MRVLFFAVLAIGCAAQNELPTTPAPDLEPSAPATVEEPASKSLNDEDVSDTHFGAAFTLPEGMPAHTALSNPQDYTGKTIRLTGTITDVCQKKGCWMVIEDNGLHMRVLMKDHAFAVAKDASGKSCDIEGIIIGKEENPEETEHYASESSPGTVIPEKSKLGNTVYQFHATGVQLAQQM